MSTLDKFWTFYDQIKVESIDPHIYFGRTEAKAAIKELIDAVRIELDTPKYSKGIVEDFIAASSLRVFYIGDMHGSFIDLHTLIHFFTSQIQQRNAARQCIKIVFLGDYVDRSALDLHTLLYLLLFFLKYPQEVILLRGNHEETIINSRYGFRDTVLANFDRELFLSIESLFALLPIVHILRTDGINIMGVHGGIPIYEINPDQAINLAEINFRTKPTSMDQMDSLYQQFLWNDPAPISRTDVGFDLNYERGDFYTFEKSIFDEFCRENELDFIVRGHQVFSDGARYFFDDRLLSLFSVSEYRELPYPGRIASITFSPEPPHDAQIELLLVEKLLEKKEPIKPDDVISEDN